MEGSHQEATEKEVERILGYLKSYFQDDRELKAELKDQHFATALLLLLL